MKKIFFYIIIASLVVVYSCSEQMEHRIPTEVAPGNNMAVFTSSSEFDAIASRITKMTDDELDQWEKSKGFVSYRSFIKKAQEDWLLLESEESKLAFYQQYSDILKIENDELIPFISISFYQAIVNREGMYQTEDFVHKVTGDYIATVKKRDFLKLKSIKPSASVSRSLDAKGVSIVRYAGAEEELNLKTTAACSPNMEASYFHNESNCRHDRRIFIAGKSYLSRYSNYEGDWWQPRVEISVYGHVRSSTFCKWSTYMTILYWRNVSYTINGWTFANNVATPQSYSFTLPDYTSKVDEFNHKDDKIIGERVLNHNISPAAFTSLHAEGSSRGVGGTWVVLDCQ